MPCMVPTVYAFFCLLVSMCMPQYLVFSLGFSSTLLYRVYAGINPYMCMAEELTFLPVFGSAAEFLSGLICLWLKGFWQHIVQDIFNYPVSDQFIFKIAVVTNLSYFCADLVQNCQYSPVFLFFFGTHLLNFSHSTTVFFGVLTYLFMASFLFMKRCLFVHWDCGVESVFRTLPHCLQFKALAPILLVHQGAIDVVFKQQMRVAVNFFITIHTSVGFIILKWGLGLW